MADQIRNKSDLDRIMVPGGLSGAVDSARDFNLSVLAGFPCPMWHSGVDKKCDYFNRSWLDFTGRTLEQELGDGWTEGVHPADVAQCFKTYNEAFDNRQPFEMDYRLRSHDGEYRCIRDIGRPTYDPDGKFRGYIGVCFDITDRHDLKKSLLDSQARTESILASIADVHILLDREGRYAYVNKA